MALTMSQSSEAILARLRDNTPVPVYDTEDESLLPSNEAGLFQPYYVVYFGGPVRTTNPGSRGIVNPSHDVHILWCTVRCTAPTTGSRNALVDDALRLLTGSRPPISCIIVLRGGIDYTVVNTTTPPVRYFKRITWQYRTNLEFDI